LIRRLQRDKSHGRSPVLGPDAFIFGSAHGERQPTIQTAWETLKMLANRIEPKLGKEGEPWNRQQLQRIDLRWHARCLRWA